VTATALAASSLVWTIESGLKRQRECGGAELSIKPCTEAVIVNMREGLPLLTPGRPVPASPSAPTIVTYALW
jgi:hypothetical protein